MVLIVTERVETGSLYKWHMYKGTFHRVPSTWRFPRCGLQSLWRQWWIGDQQRQIPPLKFLQYSDVKHIDGVPLEQIEKTRKVGPYQNNRRLISIILTDMRFLCQYMCKLVETKMGTIEQMINIAAVDQMFALIQSEMLPKDRDRQKQWLTVVRQIRQRTNPTETE
jgi:hypothetical protein